MKQLLFTFFLSITILYSKEYALISKEKGLKLQAYQIKQFYLKKNMYFDSRKIVVLNLSAQNTIRKSFEKNVLKMSLNRLKKYWIKQHYLGVRPPISLKSQKSVLLFIRKVDLGIGYVEFNKVPKDMYILYKWSDEK